MRERRALLSVWVQSILGRECSLSPAAGDASARRYWRVRADGRSYVLMDASPVDDGLERFVEIGLRLRALGLNAPEVLAHELGRGLILLSDLGTRHYLDALDEAQVDGLYGDALAALLVIQSRASTKGLPLYDGPLLRREMELFREWLLSRYLGCDLSAAENAMLDRAFNYLEASALEQPLAFVHRDFHSRNLMVTEPPSPGILDFQDSVIGPVTYDPVSLLRDCYVAWPRERVEEWARGYAAQAVQSGILRKGQEGSFMPWFDLMGVQRQLKASGIFARLHLRDGKSNYLGDIPRTLGYVLEVAPAYAKLRGLVDLVRDRVVPGLARPVVSAATGPGHSAGQ